MTTRGMVSANRELLITTCPDIKAVHSPYYIVNGTINTGNLVVPVKLVNFFDTDTTCSDLTFELKQNINEQGQNKDQILDLISVQREHIIVQTSGFRYNGTFYFDIFCKNTNGHSATAAIMVNLSASYVPDFDFNITEIMYPQPEQ